MFDKYALCPGGAIMLHESVAEFDTNATPDPAANPDVQVVENIKTELAKAPADYCPIGALAEKLRPTFNLIQNMRREYLDVSTSEEQISLLNKISNAATEVADMIRCLLVKQNAIIKMYDCSQDWKYEPIKTHLGWFLKNYNRIVSTGNGTYTRNMISLPALNDWDVQKAVATYMASSEGLHHNTFDLGDMYKVTSYNHTTTPFADMTDMFNCLINDKDRTMKLTKTITDSYELEGLINGCTSCNNVCAVDGGPSFLCELMSWISVTYRLVKCGCYDLQCDIMDNKELDFLDRVRPLMIGVVNIFYIGATKLFTDAYTIKSITDGRKSLEDYVAVVMGELK